MIADVGKTFGKANTLNRDEPGSVNLKNWREEQVWRDGAECVGNMPKSLTGTLRQSGHLGGRPPLPGRLADATDGPADARPVRGGALCVQTGWRTATKTRARCRTGLTRLKGKIAEVVNRDCSQSTQAADAR